MKIQLTISALLIPSLCLGMTACSSLPVSHCLPGEKLEFQESLYFGTGKPDGVVTAEEWNQFLDTIVTPHFPEGLTVVSASGQWQSSSGEIVKEASYVLTLIHADTEENELAITEISNEYKTQFQQEAVLRVKNSTCVSY
ncbi:DUF3574 domain-containing protein [Hahella sp. CCB-MM4]|uniref:DUF3574 domain-containing protein n=1 Tax=Hahella sp. (strain CCB-MM4) TaxID=1926491 RepID=UPI00143DBE9C|nr:DUF3574 domain-containing protein [Hahella sp. CCB-MM4]